MKRRLAGEAAAHRAARPDQQACFESDVKPLLSQKCYTCHGQEVQQSGLRLDKRQNALRGGDYSKRGGAGDTLGEDMHRFGPKRFICLQQP
jgi:hypothetical protein